MAYDVEKLHRMENALRTTACLVGKPSASLNEDGFKVGLGLTNEADICQNAADAVKEGVFKTIVMGTFNNEKCHTKCHTKLNISFFHVTPNVTPSVTPNPKNAHFHQS